MKISKPKKPVPEVYTLSKKGILYINNNWNKLSDDVQDYLSRMTINNFSVRTSILNKITEQTGKPLCSLISIDGNSEQRRISKTFQKTK